MTNFKICIIILQKIEERKNILKKIIIIILVLIFALTCFSGCKQAFSPEEVETTLPENGVIVTVDPIEETVEAEEILNKIIKE